MNKNEECGMDEFLKMEDKWSDKDKDLCGDRTTDKTGPRTRSDSDGWNTDCKDALNPGARTASTTGYTERQAWIDDEGQDCFGRTGYRTDCEFEDQQRLCCTRDKPDDGTVIHGRPRISDH